VWPGYPTWPTGQNIFRYNKGKKKLQGKMLRHCSFDSFLENRTLLLRHTSREKDASEKLHVFSLKEKRQGYTYRKFFFGVSEVGQSKNQEVIKVFKNGWSLGALGENNTT